MTYGRRHYLTQLVLARLAYAGPTSDETREFLKASVRLIVAMTLIFFGLAAVSSGQEQEKTTAGEFLYRTGPDSMMFAAPTVDTRVRFDVTGVIARAKVVQRFRNPTDKWIEGAYVFPLPETAAVDHLRMRAGDRVIEGQIREKEQARREFLKAAGEGKRASLVEQQRPNMFTSRVANLGPYEELEVEIEYQQALLLHEGQVTLRFPLAITPRYMPSIGQSLAQLTLAAGPPVIQPEPPDGSEGGAFDEESDPDGQVESEELDEDFLLQAPLMPTGVKVNPVSIELNLNAGFAVEAVTSATHSIIVEPSSAHSFQARLRSRMVPSDRDFEISWRAVPGLMPQTSLTTEKGPDGTYALVTLFPPTGPGASSVRIPREVTFIIDTSGSMEGVSMQQAKTALALAIHRLDPADSFNVIEFNSAMSTLFPHPVPASPGNREQAAHFVTSLHASGGTEMMPALAAALLDTASSGESEAALKQVFFLTDGAVGNEDELFSFIKLKLGRARLFPVGIGPAPNSHFMTKAAEFGRGTFTFISDVNAVEKQMTELFEKVDSPVLSDIQVSFEGIDVESAEVWPDRIPDLYLGEPVVVGARFIQAPSMVRVRGQRDGQRFDLTVPLGQAEEGHGINVLWARRKIQSLLDGLHEGDNQDAVRAQVVSLGLTHHLVTAHTSLVAVDVTPARPEGDALESALVPVNAPAGSMFGGLPRSATPATLYLLQGLVACFAAVTLLIAARRS